MTNTNRRPSTSTLLSIINSTTDYDMLSMDQVSIGWGLEVHAAVRAQTARAEAIHTNRANRLAQAAANRGFEVRFGFTGAPIFERSNPDTRSERWAAIAAGAR